MILKLCELTEFPGPRYKSLGPDSGEWFRDEHLMGLIEKHGSDIIIDLDGTAGYGSSFLEETFGGLIRSGVDPQIVLQICSKIVSQDDESLPVEITGYVEDAIKAKNEG